MLSVLIATEDSERALVPTLAALIPGVTAGLIREVIIADGGSRDATAEVADVAGCRLVAGNGSTGARLKHAAATARAGWFLFLCPGAVLDAAWVGAAAHFMQSAEQNSGDHAATFRRAPMIARPTIAEIFALLRTRKILPEQGLLIAKDFYDRLGGHRDCTDAEADFLRRLGGRRLVLLASAVSRA